MKVHEARSLIAWFDARESEIRPDGAHAGDIPDDPVLRVSVLRAGKPQSFREFWVDDNRIGPPALRRLRTEPNSWDAGFQINIPPLQGLDFRWPTRWRIEKFIRGDARLPHVNRRLGHTCDRSSLPPLACGEMGHPSLTTLREN